MIECPADDCSVELDSDDLIAQKKHMDLVHPDIVARRLEQAGFWQDPETGRWIDMVGE